MATAPARILTVNAGSSTLKLRLLDGEDAIVYEREGGPVDCEETARKELAALLEEAGAVDAAGHQVVHGGAEFDGPSVVEPWLEEQLDRLADLAPLHNPPAVAAMRALESLRPGLPAVACFDTSFRATLPRRRPPTPSRPPGPTAGRYAATASTVSPTPTPAAAPPSCWAARSPNCAWSPPTSAPGPRSPPSRAAARSRRLWGSRRWRAW